MKHKIIVPGFKFAGIHAGIKDDPKKKDLALIYSEEEKTIVDGVFTLNRVCAPPVKLCRDVVRKGYGQLVVVNSGIANACTGARGMRDALKTQKKSAALFGLDQSRVFVCSTGKIGEYLPMNRLLPGLKKAKASLSAGNFLEAVRGIMTTDQFPKYEMLRTKISGKPAVIAVMAKGAGMLRPDMATLLTYVLTDIAFARPVLRKIFRNAVNKTLNRITVDGDTSTNDTVLIMANARAGNKIFSAESPDGKKVESHLALVLESVAKKVTLDGEGATKCCRVNVRGAKNNHDARKIAYAIGNSPLVKTALFGCDPNWGRIMAAVGYSGANISEEKIGIRIGPHEVTKNGTAGNAALALVSRYMKRENIEISVDCKKGRGEFYIYMSDLTYDYVNLNAEYHT